MATDLIDHDQDAHVSEDRIRLHALENGDTYRPFAGDGDGMSITATISPVVMAGDHARCGKYVSRILYIAARRRWKESRGLVQSVTENTTKESEAN